MQPFISHRQPTLEALQSVIPTPILAPGWYVSLAGDVVLVYQEEGEGETEGVWRALVYHCDPRPLMRQVLDLPQFMVVSSPTKDAS